MGIICSGASDIGRKRKTNQDSICMDFKHHFFAVADGMGGHNGGDIASQLSVKIMPDFFDSNQQLDPQALLKSMILDINKEIIKKADEQPDLKGMGTTVSAILFHGQNLYIGNVGDSRVYMVNGNNIYQMTRDHSLVQEKLNHNYYSREQAAKDPDKNVLVRSVGIDLDLLVDVFNYRISKNDIFIVCSDGLHGKVSDADILYIIQQTIADPATCTKEIVESAVSKLIERANENGGQDNISVIIAVAQA
jgi:serine/threonine protein phosphatase PrpC